MLTRTTIALVGALVMCAAPVAMAQSHTRHSQVTHSRVTHSYTSSEQSLRNAGYAGPVYSVSPKTGFYFVPSRSITGDSCDLPSSGCSNDERISN
jgi:hypothetical protein